MAEKSTGYDEFARARIWVVLQKIKRKKTLTWMELAAQVQAQSGTIFDRRYFRRLRDGQLGTELVHAVVLTISARFVPNFEEELKNRDTQRKIRLNASETFTNMSSSLFEFIRIPDVDRKLFASKVSYQGNIQLDPTTVDVFERPLSFFSDAQLYRLVDHIDIPARTTYFVASQESSLTLDGSTTFTELLKEFQLTISANSIFDLVLFFSNFFYQEDIIPIVGWNAALQHSHETGLDTVATIERHSIDIPPSIASDGTNYIGSFLAANADKLQRVDFEVEPTGHILRFDESTLAVMDTVNQSEKTARYFQSVVFKRHPSEKHLLTSLRKHLNRGQIGQSFDEMCASGMLDVQFYSARDFSVVYDAVSVSVVISAPHDQELLSERNVLDVVKKIRFADQHLIGFTVRPVESDLLAYATAMQSKVLDSVLWSLKFVDTVEDESQRQRFIDALSIEELELLEAIRRCASNSELFDIYSGASNSEKVDLS